MGYAWVTVGGMYSVRLYVWGNDKSINKRKSKCSSFGEGEGSRMKGATRHRQFPDTKEESNEGRRGGSRA